MPSSWLREYVLEELGFEIRKASPGDNGATATVGMGMGTTQDQARLVRILDRGQGRRFERGDGNSDNNSSMNTTLRSSGNDWWNVNRRGKSPNLAKNTDAWLLVSDGSHSARLYLTIEALREIFDWDSRNNNEDNLFGRGCCVLLKKYSIECHVDKKISKSENKGDSNCLRRSLRHQHHDFQLELKVLSLEPKPGFNHHHGTTTNRVNHNDKNNKPTIRPVMEETEVLYGLQFLARPRQQYMRNTSSGSNDDIHNSLMNRAYIARDWDIAFGSLSKGRLNISTTADNEAEAVLDTDRDLDDILELAEEAASSDAAIRDWEMAKTEHGITTMDGTKNNSSYHKTQKQMNEQHEDHEDNDQDEDEVSRMYIQNVLSNEEGGNESLNDNSLTIQKEYEGDDDESQSSDSEVSLLPETQSKVTFTKTTCATSPIIKNNSVLRATILHDMKTNDEDDGGNINVMLQMQPADEERKEYDENIAETTREKRHKRPRINSFESGTASNLSLDEAINSPAGKRSSTKHMRLRQQQQLLRHKQQERFRNSIGIWESIKEQLFDPGRTILYCVPSNRMLSGSDSHGDEKMLSTPKRILASTTRNVKNSGSAASIGTNFTSSTPNPSSGAYYRKFGLTRWLSQNTIDEEQR